jgi:hypothetical protein
LDFDNTGLKKEFWAIMSLAHIIKQTNIYPLEALCEAASIRKDFADDYLAAINAGKNL